LVTYYILPLVGVNKLTFGRSYKASYISKDGKNVYVELSKNMHNLLTRQIITMCLRYFTEQHYL